MKKATLLLLVTLCLLLSACSSTNISDEFPNVPPSQQGSAPASESAASDSASEVSARVVVNGAVHQLSGYEYNGSYFFQQTDLPNELRDADLAGAETFEKNSVDYFSLRDICASANYSFTHDDVLAAEYIWTYADAAQAVTQSDEVGRAVSMGIGEVKPEDAVVTYAEFFTMLDRIVELAAPDKLADWQTQFPKARASADAMTRYEGMKAVLKCAVALGGDFATFNVDWLPLNDKIGEKVWDEMGRIPNPDRYIPNDYPYQGGGFPREDFSEWDDCGVAYRYSFGRISLVSNQSIFDYDEAENSMRPDLPFTYEAAVLAAIRLLESSSAQSDFIALTDPKAITYDSTIITAELLRRANARPEVSQDNLPLLKGLVFGGDYEFTGMPVTEAELRNAANWGFNSARVMLTFQTLFDMDVTTVQETKLKQLDKLVAAAMKYNLHLNLVTFSMPGRWANFDAFAFTSVGEFDLFTNKEKQKQAADIWTMLAERYKDIPNSALSFSPLWEVFNRNLSTGLPFEPYKDTDVARVFDLLMETIRQQDPDRFVIYEPTSATPVDGISQESALVQSTIEDKYSNVMMMTNFCEGPFVYANMTVEAGENIDNNNHSIFLPEYPTVIYKAQQQLPNGQALEMTGELVQGTKLDIFLSEVWGTGDLEILADGKSLYRERLSTQSYEKGYPLSAFYPYAKSDKLISVTLEFDVDKLEIRFSGDLFEWSGIDVTLPDQYAVERWWFQTSYDAMLEGEETLPPSLERTSVIMLAPNNLDVGRQIVINPDVTYTSESVWAQSSKETIEAWAKSISEFAPHSVVRIETANFNACSLDAALAYYNDVFEVLDRYGLGWYSNDYINFSNSGRRYVGFTPVSYLGGSYCIELLQQLQQWQ
ncbi:MAG TPA: cellulase family glycosylhydrolase [Feifaniaceae bacterium]|nr:cellulase family glycosylhydrolase [Feifaniaceae bacterium]